MSNYILKYPLDLRGTSATNRVVDEVHTVSEEGARLIIPNYGPFYTKNLVVKNYATGETLVPREQWKAAQLYQEAVQRTGEEVCAVIIITDPAITSSQFSITYQVVGGKFSRAVPVIQDLIEDLEIDEREVMWGDILAAPEAFPPVSHLHDAGDLYGFEYLTAALEQIHQAILIGDAEEHNVIIGYIEAREAESIARDEAITDNLNGHIGDKSNPHDVTKTQVGLGNVDNFPTANQTEAEQGTVSNRFMTPLRTSQAIQQQVGTSFSNHANNVSNPHNVTKTQVGLGSVDNYPTSTQGEAEAGAANNRFMTPLRTKQAIDEQVREPFVAHAGDTSNPHQVTKSQVGLGSVANYGVATVSEAQVGSVNDKYVTPLRVKQAIDSQLRPEVSSHVNNTSNPHNVTKAQVGLGNVANYPMAHPTTDVGANASRSDLMTSPQYVRELISITAEDALDQHADNTNNPHQVTKTQVGLGCVPNWGTLSSSSSWTSLAGSFTDRFLNPSQIKDLTEYWAPRSTTQSDVGLSNVSNYSVASQSDAEAGTSNSRYMTPLRTKQAIEQFGGGGVSNDNIWSATVSPTYVTSKTCYLELKRIDIGPFRLVQMVLDGYIHNDSQWPVIPSWYRPDRKVGFVIPQENTADGSQCNIVVDDDGSISSHDNFSGILYQGTGMWMVAL